ADGIRDLNVTGVQTCALPIFVDNTRTKYGKFKPWLLIGTIVSAILLVVCFTGIFGLSKANWLLFAIAFVIIFVALDIFYSFSDKSEERRVGKDFIFCSELCA